MQLREDRLPRRRWRTHSRANAHVHRAVQHVRGSRATEDDRRALHARLQSNRFPGRRLPHRKVRLQRGERDPRIRQGATAGHLQGGLHSRAVLALLGRRACAHDAGAAATRLVPRRRLRQWQLVRHDVQRRALVGRLVDAVTGARPAQFCPLQGESDVHGGRAGRRADRRALGGDATAPPGGAAHRQRGTAGCVRRLAARLHGPAQSEAAGREAVSRFVEGGRHAVHDADRRRGPGLFFGPRQQRVSRAQSELFLAQTHQPAPSQHAARRRNGNRHGRRPARAALPHLRYGRVRGPQYRAGALLSDAVRGHPKRDHNAAARRHDRRPHRTRIRAVQRAPEGVLGDALGQPSAE